MKFTKEQLTEALKARLTVNGKKLAMSERTLQRNAERLYGRLEKSNDESELDDVVTEYLPDYEEIDGNHRKDYADFIKEWKENHPDTKPDPKPDPKPTGDEKYDAILKEITELRKEREAEKAERTAADKRKELVSKFKEKGIKDEKWIESYVRKLQLSKDTDVEAETTDALTLYNTSHAAVDPSQTPGPAGGGAGDDKTGYDDVKSIIKQKRHIVE